MLFSLPFPITITLNSRFMMSKSACTICYIALLLVAFLLASCGTTEDFSGFSYDPEGATVTTNKQVELQHRRRIGVDKGSIWVSNEFAGARMNDFYKVSDSLYRVVITPENHPVNNSPWYAFTIWSDTTRTINLQLQYQHGDHRYIPKLSENGALWQRIDSTQFREDTTAGTATLTLDLNQQKRWISAQELLTMDTYKQWTDSLAAANYVSHDTVGYSHQQRPITKITVSEVPDTKPRGIMIITGRLHPPEVTGALASQHFLNEVTSDTKLASQFRKSFEVWTYPVANPDGVQQGHWRHNAKGVDLNRDWQAFNQPETQAIRDDLLPLKSDSLRTVYYGIDFHSTNENIFYPIERKVQTFPDDFTYQWIDSLKKEFPNSPMSVEPFDTSSPITKNWIYHTFGADAVTYELNDQANRDSIRAVSRTSAQIIMEQLLEAKEKQ